MTSESTLICIHHVRGKCRDGEKCTKKHVAPTQRLLDDIDKKGPYICSFHPNCKFDSYNCKKIHIDEINTEDIDNFRNIYVKFLGINSSNKEYQDQVARFNNSLRFELKLINNAYNIYK